MANYLRPDVYVERIDTGEKPIQSTSTSVGALIGVATRGRVGVATLVTSWTDYVNKFAKGLDTPFLRSSDLAHSVFGFFLNGGSACYVTRVPVASMAKAQVTATKHEEPGTNLIITACDEGDWANNNLKVTITGVDGGEDYFDVKVTFKDTVVEIFRNLSNTEEDERFYAEVINNESEFIRIAKDQKLFAVEETPLTGGAYNISGVKDTDFTGKQGLLSLEPVEDVNLIAIPGRTSDDIITALNNFVAKRTDCFYILDAPMSDTVDTEALKTFRKKAKGNGAVYFPWGKIKDPLSVHNIVRNCPPSGHVMGVYANTDNTRGVYKEPAGLDARVKGFIGLTTEVSPTDQEVLNPLGINCLLNKHNQGIVVWGARNVANDSKKPYVSDIRYDIMVNKTLYNGTQWAVFEPIDDVLLSKFRTSLVSFLDQQWRDGALKGASSDEAYYVKCDNELNTEKTISQGLLISEIGYAKKKPAEFVVIRIIQKQN